MAAQMTTNSANSWSPDIVSFAAQDIIPEALVMQTSTVAGKVEGDAPAVRVPFVDDAEADFVAEGTEIPEADPALAEVVVHTGKVAQLIRISREQWVQDGAAGMLSDSVRRAIINRANTAYLAQPAPTSPAVTPPAGLLNIDGVHDGGIIGDDLDTLADAFAVIEAANGTPNVIIASPSAWSHMRKLKTGTEANTMLLGAGTQDTEKRLFGTPVLTSPAVPAGDLVVLDSTAVVSAVGDVLVQTSEHVYFAADSIGLRATFRFGQNLVRPDRVARLSIA